MDKEISLRPGINAKTTKQIIINPSPNTTFERYLPPDFFDNFQLNERKKSINGMEKIKKIAPCASEAATIQLKKKSANVEMRIK